MPVFNRRIPSDWTHVDRHRMLRAAPLTLSVEKVLNIPRQYSTAYDQGQEGACVGFSQSWMMSILNRKLYDARKLYQEAQAIDEFTDTPPGEGTTLRAGFDVLRTKGHWRVFGGKTRIVELDEGIESNQWAIRVDEVRECISRNVPVNFGINWYSQFSNPVRKPRVDDISKPHMSLAVRRIDYWIGEGSDWGFVQGGHAITCVGASDQRQAFALVNTWGEFYPFIVWLPYMAAQRLLDEEGEAGLVSDRL